jgi:hypothetical protein
VVLLLLRVSAAVALHPEGVMGLNRPVRMRAGTSLVTAVDCF